MSFKSVKILFFAFSILISTASCSNSFEFQGAKIGQSHSEAKTLLENLGYKVFAPKDKPEYLSGNIMVDEPNGVHMQKTFNFLLEKGKVLAFCLNVQCYSKNLNSKQKFSELKKIYGEPDEVYDAALEKDNKALKKQYPSILAIWNGSIKIPKDFNKELYGIIDLEILGDEEVLVWRVWNYSEHCYTEETAVISAEYRQNN